jgi:hypothetical protein
MDILDLSGRCCSPGKRLTTERTEAHRELPRSGSAEVFGSETNFSGSARTSLADLVN